LDIINARLRAVARVVFTIVTILTGSATSFGQLNVIISGGFSAPYRELLPEFERTTGISVTTASGASQGNGPDTIGAQLGRGVPADVVILNRSGLSELIGQHRIVPRSDRDLASTPIGIAVRAGRPRRDISTVDGVKQALLQAKVVAVTGSNPSMLVDVLPRLGIVNQVTVRVGGRYTETIAMVARGDVELAIMPVSEILNMPGVELGGTIPSELLHPTVYAAAIVAASNQREAAQQLIRFLSSDTAIAAIKRNGMEPASRR
jgi:molybdate transport system substrate-binding protein